MDEYSEANVKLSDAQLKKVAQLSLKMPCGSDMPHELLLTTRQKTKLRNAYNNNMSTDLTLSKSQMAKIIQSGGFLESLLSKSAGPLIKVAIPLAKNLVPLGITAAASAIKAGIQKKMHGSGTAISNKEMNDIMRIRLLKIIIFCWKKSLKQLKTKQKNKKDDS